MFFSENQKFIKFVDAQNGSGARRFGPYSFGHTTIKKTLSFYERFGRFPISEKETELLSNDRALKGLELAGPERAVHVFKEKILAVPRGTVKLPGGYEVVVPENIVESVGDRRFADTRSCHKNHESSERKNDYWQPET